MKWGIILGIISWSIVLILLVWLTGCDDGCANHSLRCNENNVQRCIDGDWLYAMNCDKVTMLDGTQEPGECCVDTCELKGQCND